MCDMTKNIASGSPFCFFVCPYSKSRLRTRSYIIERFFFSLCRFIKPQIAYNEARASEATSWSDPHSLYKMSWTLTPSTQTIVSSVLPGKRPKSLQELALQANLKYESTGQHRDDLTSHIRIGAAHC